jgi:tryptophan 2,3-dioxygenase
MGKEGYSDISGARLDLSRDMSYGDYLRLDALLGCQRPLTSAHDEMLFISVHHVTEIWMKLMLHELIAAREQVRRDEAGPALKMLSRARGVLGQMIQLWEVLSTMTPADYLSFRDALGHSSGFQSYQYRTIEYLLGSKDARMLCPHAHRPELHGPLKVLLDAPSLYDEVLFLLRRKGFAIDAAHLERDFSQPYVANQSVCAAWREIYHDTNKYWDLYELAEKLADVEDWFQLWRYRHMSVVQRIIGGKSGTGGTSGVTYLKQAVGRLFFPELMDVRTGL